MKTLKTSLLLVFVCLAISSKVSGQNIPFIFKKLTRQISQNIAKIDTSNHFIISKKTDTVKLIAKKPNETILSDGDIKRNLYIELANKLNRRADTIEAIIQNSYKKSLTTIHVPATTGEIPIFKSTIATIEQTKSGDMKNVSALRNAAKEAIYTSKTSGNLNFLFVGNATDAQMYYTGSISDNKAKFLSNSLISFGSDGSKVSIYNELYADFYGPIRIGFGALVSNNQAPATNSPTAATSTETQKDAVQRLLGGGGNGVFNASYPILNFQNYDNSFFIKLLAAPKFAVDVPKLGTQNNKYSYSWDPGVEGTVFYTGALNVLTFYTNFRFGVIGGNGSFYDNLLKTDAKSFMFDQLSLGFAINSTFRLSYNIYYGSSFVRANFPATISFNIIPN